MLITKRKFGIFNFGNIYFAEEPFSVALPDCNVITYYTYKNWGDIKGYEKNKCLRTIIDLTQECDAIWKRINRQHKRHIQRAEKNGTIVKMSNNYKEFHQIYKQFLKQKDVVDPFGLNILSSEFMQKYGVLFIVENQSEIIGGNLYFHDKDTAFVVSTAYKNFENTIENNKKADSNCYLHWKAMQYFKKMNITKYDLGDVSSDDIKISHKLNGGEYFKRCFGGEVVSLYKYTKFNSHANKLLFHLWNFLQTLE
jgi:lipid II:glycine glycyltransferase (peptidoglycan interpeptide bridge formation enzyme)